jgi:hypothetical protein
LLDLKQSVDEMYTSFQIAGPKMDRKVKISEAKWEIFAEYDFLLNELAK